MKKQNEEILNEEVTTVEQTAEETVVPTAPAKNSFAKKLRAKFKQRKFRFGAISTVITVAVIVVCVLLNVVFGILHDRFPLNIDLTSDMIYTLSDESKDFIETIDKNVEITMFMSEETVTGKPFSAEYDELNTIFMQFHEMVSQYESLSDGKVKMTYVDLTANPTLANQYEKYEVDSSSILFTCEDRHKVISYDMLFSATQTGTNYYGGATYEYDSNVETILAAQISILVEDRDVGVVMLTGHGENSSIAAGVKETFELSGYTFTDLNLLTASEWPENAEVAMIMGATVDFTEDELTKLRSWLSNNGKLERNLVVMLDPNATLPNLFEFLEVDYGIEVTDKMVYETDTDRMAMLGYSINPLVVYGDIESSDYTADLEGAHAITSGNRQLITHFENDPEATMSNVPLLTFPDSAELIDVKAEDAKDSKPADEYPIVGMAMAVQYTYDNDTAGSPQVVTNVVVGGSSMLMHPTIMGLQQTKNEKLMLKLLNGMTDNESTTEISSKSVKQETLEFSAGTQVTLGLWVFTIIVPIITIAIGLVVFIKRKNL